MKFNIKYYLLVPLSLILVIACQRMETNERDNNTDLNVLIFSKTGGYRHECIEPGGAALKSYFEANGITSTHTEDSSIFNGKQLSPFDVVIFFQTTGNILDSIQEQALMDHVRSGKGFVGIHAAADTEYDWNWYAGLVGAQFSDHPDIQPATIVKIDTQHIACKHLPERWTRTDEWYNFKQIPSNVNLLLAIDEATYQGGKHDTLHPMSWNHTYDGGRSFYTAMGHTVESYSDTLFLKHILEGVKWVAKR